MTTNEITNGDIQFKYAEYRTHLSTYAANRKAWNEYASLIVEKTLRGIIQNAGLPAELEITETEDGKILDFELEGRLLAFVPAKNGTIGVSILEAKEEGDPLILEDARYHKPEEFENVYLVRNYVFYLIDTLDAWDAKPE